MRLTHWASLGFRLNLKTAKTLLLHSVVFIFSRLHAVCTVRHGLALTSNCRYNRDCVLCCYAIDRLPSFSGAALHKLSVTSFDIDVEINSKFCFTAEHKVTDRIHSRGGYVTIYLLY